MCEVFFVRFILTFICVNTATSGWRRVVQPYNRHTKHKSSTVCFGPYRTVEQRYFFLFICVRIPFCHRFLILIPTSTPRYSNLNFIQNTVRRICQTVQSPSLSLSVMLVSTHYLLISIDLTSQLLYTYRSSQKHISVDNSFHLLILFLSHTSALHDFKIPSVN